ncbi:toxin HipA [Labilibaculum filiforme]|uniref:Toxin HipA n=1 Tax=Labilibaculum filiforme TaxID=1940526 RepID=A0A2N3HWV0_9BACT|nr:HipA domain-containing protein [Labilibaculum filiforme]PKQ62517.1 toxin HipA [Labilibaculum filiforme]
MNKVCLNCYQPLKEGQNDFHPACCKKIFNRKDVPVLPYSEDQILELANQVIKSQIAVTGVQPKLSMEIAKSKDDQGQMRFTIVGLWGGYILKPPTQRFCNMPELEDLTLHLASIAKIETVPHSLIRMQNGKLAYITKRIDRVDGKKLHMEDMCQLTERLTEFKYRGSYEQIGKAIEKYSMNPGLDLVNFFEQVVFSFLTGNADMHLKNFSLINNPILGYVLTPAYDMLSTALIMPEDDEDLALTLNAKKKKIKRKDFTSAFNLFEIPEKTQNNIFLKFEKVVPSWFELIKISFLPEDMKEAYIELILMRAGRLDLNLK